MTADLRRRIFHVEKQLEAQQAELRLLKAQLTTQTKMIAFPVLALPPEIVSEIFLYSFEPGPFLALDSKAAPMMLLYVCKTWNRIALGTPALWSNVLCRLASGEKALRALAVLAERSGSTPLSVCIVSDAENPVRYDIHTFSVLFCQHSHRIRSLDMRVSSADLRVIDSYKPQLPALRELGSYAAEHTSRISMFRDAPNLSVVRFDHRHLDHIPFRWHNITALHAATSGLNMLLHAWQKMPNLAVCSYEPEKEDMTEEDIERGNAPVVVHKTIRALHAADFLCYDEPTTLLYYCRLPALETLVLNNVLDLDIVPFLDDSAPPLRRLILSAKKSRVICIPKVTQTLALMPHLTELDLSLCERDTYREFCAEFSRSPSVLPKLERLSLLSARYDRERSEGDELECLEHGALLELMIEAVSSRQATAPAKWKYQIRTLHIKMVEQVDVVYVSKASAIRCDDMSKDGVDLQLGPAADIIIFPHHDNL
ncbi:F-box domain-containing protein [Mycena chlorophos]|uniref:F-box domain-containing protein n=1 Tax=Mycena chlorophos TaxID=658473 RepID=A0A8H6S736_MYCCL|nr:F-box domain-containing protein [Mycena chlorophos]